MKNFPYSTQTISAQDINAVVKVLRSPWLTQGPAIKKFEDALSRVCGSRFAVAVSSGTAALHIAYLAAGLDKGDEVVTTPNTFAATATMVLACGGTPVFGDIRLDNGNIDETRIEHYVSAKTKIIVPVHFAGNPAKMDTIMRIAKKHKLVVIEDACHALGAEYKGQKIGSLQSDMTVFSFHPVKSMTTGEGGAILTHHKTYYEKLLLLRSHGIEKNAQGVNKMKYLGFNYRMTDIQAALGESQLKKLEGFIAARERIATWYEQELSNVKHIILPQKNPRARSSWHLYVIRLMNPRLRNPLLRYLRKHGMGATIHYPPIYSHPYYRNNGFAKITLPNAEIYSSSCLSIPCFPLLKQNEVKFISSRIKTFFKQS